MISTVPRVTVEYRRAQRAVGYPWRCEPYMAAQVGDRSLPLFPVTIEELRTVQKYGRWFEPRSFARMMTRLTIARRREALGFLAAMLHRAVAALHLAGLSQPGRALDQARPAASLLVLCPHARAPSRAVRGAPGNGGVSPP